MDFKTPTLIKGTLKKPFNCYRESSLLAATSLKNPSDLKILQDTILAIKSRYAEYRFYKSFATLAKHIKDDRSYALRIFADLEDDFYSKYELAISNLLSKEDLIVDKDSGLWVDTANHCILSFDRQFMYNLDSILRESF